MITAFVLQGCPSGTSGIELAENRLLLFRECGGKNIHALCHSSRRQEGARAQRLFSVGRSFIPDNVQSRMLGRSPIRNHSVGCPPAGSPSPSSRSILMHTQQAPNRLCSSRETYKYLFHRGDLSAPQPTKSRSQHQTAGRLGGYRLLPSGIIPVSVYHLANLTPILGARRNQANLSFQYVYNHWYARARFTVIQVSLPQISQFSRRQ